MASDHIWIRSGETGVPGSLICTGKGWNRRLESTNRLAMATSGVHSIMMVKSAHPGMWGGGGTPSLFQSTVSTIESKICGVRSIWEGRYTPPISTQPFAPLWLKLMQMGMYSYWISVRWYGLLSSLTLICTVQCTSSHPLKSNSRPGTLHFVVHSYDL